MAVQSWVIVEIATGKAVMETFDARLVKALNADRYRAVRAGEYLASLNDPQPGELAALRAEVARMKERG